MAATISSLLIDCLRQFNSLISRDDLISHKAEIPVSLWFDELGRLRVWAANIGAHQSGQSSLDYRLRDASHIKCQTIKLLEGLRQTFKDLDEVLTEVDDEHEDLEPDDGEDTEIQQIYRGLVDTINCLFLMSMIIRRPAQHDRLLGTKKADVTAFEPYDRQHVAHKYSNADNTVVDRLGSAISRRRAALKYRERHHAKLSKGIDHALDDQHDTVSTRLSETIATDFEEAHIKVKETASNSGVSQTSYAQTLLGSGDAITIPPPPKDSADEQPFECPYCFFIITIPNKRSWARHVFKDLMPYICVFPDCSTSYRLYDSRREWFHHLQSKHLLRSALDTEVNCPLRCGVVLSGVRLERHLGRHLEELALFAVPRTMPDEDDNSDKSRRSSARPRVLDNDRSDVSSEEGADRDPNAIGDLLSIDTAAAHPEPETHPALHFEPRLEDSNNPDLDTAPKTLNVTEISAQREVLTEASRASVETSEPNVIREPPIHQETITHHRHIEHGYEPGFVRPRPARVESDESTGIGQQATQPDKLTRDEVLDRYFKASRLDEMEDTFEHETQRGEDSIFLDSPARDSGSKHVQSSATTTDEPSRVSLSKWREANQGLDHGDASPPLYPILEAYHGTYQSISPMRSPGKRARTPSPRRNDPARLVNRERDLRRQAQEEQRHAEMAAENMRTHLRRVQLQREREGEEIEQRSRLQRQIEEGRARIDELRRAEMERERREAELRDEVKTGARTPTRGRRESEETRRPSYREDELPDSSSNQPFSQSASEGYTTVRRYRVPQLGRRPWRMLGKRGEDEGASDEEQPENEIKANREKEEADSLVGETEARDFREKVF